MKFFKGKMKRKHYFSSYALEQFIRMVEEFYTFVYFSNVQQSVTYEIYRDTIKSLLSNLRQEQNLQKEVVNGK